MTGHAFRDQCLGWHLSFTNTWRFPNEGASIITVRPTHPSIHSCDSLQHQLILKFGCRVQVFKKYQSGPTRSQDWIKNLKDLTTLITFSVKFYFLFLIIFVPVGFMFFSFSFLQSQGISWHKLSQLNLDIYLLLNF